MVVHSAGFRLELCETWQKVTGRIQMGNFKLRFRCILVKLKFHVGTLVVVVVLLLPLRKPQL